MPGTFVVAVPAGPVLVPLLVGVAAVWLLALSHRRTLTWARALTVLVATAYAVGVLSVTFFPWQVPFGTTEDVLVGGGLAPLGHDMALRSLLNVVPLVTLDPVTFVLNVVMTVPLGALLPLVVRVRSVAGVALVGLLVSGTIEVGQGVGDVLLGMNRTVDVNDLIANVTGAVLGLLLLRTVVAATGSAPTRYALAGSAVAGPSDPTVPETGSATEGASTATTPAARSAVPKMRSPNSAYGSR